MFYEADTIFRVVRKYSNPKLRVPDFLGNVKSTVISGTYSQNPKFKLLELPQPEIFE
jgi:hypothetical protein